MTKILVDLSHNEMYRNIPDTIFDIDYVFSFLHFGEPFPTVEELLRYDILIIAEIIPAKNQIDHLFHDDEINSIKKYVKEGGRLLLTTGSGGDSNYTSEQGSVRALKPITGIVQAYWGELYNKTKDYHDLTPENLVFREFPDHPIFRNINKIVFADTTYFRLSKYFNATPLLTTTPGTKCYFYGKERSKRIENAPIIVENNYGFGKSISIGCTYFMSDNDKFGVSIADNGILFQNIINWLLDKT